MIMKSNKEKISWTDDRIALLKRMWKEGKSAAEIAKSVGKGVTRNAVIGKAHRMGLSGRPSPIKKETEAKKPAAAVKKVAPPKAAPAPAKRLPASPAIAKKPAFSRESEVAPPTRFEKEAVPPGGGVALLDLTERMCKWPIGDPRDDDFTFCGLGIRQGTPYCPQHASLAYQASSRRTMLTTTAPVEKDEDPAEAEEAEEPEVDEAEEAV
jgi:GcrA cell cycle regulator